ncbi:MAG: GspE/PulE family protein [Nitrospirae bacterium]|nr:MAG: GspE/PulE family protein [Nitrospirota bacterium]
MPQDSIKSLEEKLLYERKLVQLVSRLSAARNLDNIFELYNEILALLDAERMSFYVMDADKMELFTKFPDIDPIKEIRLPLNEKSIAGYVALTQQVVNIPDAYIKTALARISPRLAFDSSWDKRTGFHTIQVLTVPILYETKTLGVLQLLNKKHGTRFTSDDEASAARIAKPVGIALSTQYLLAQKQSTKFDSLLVRHLITKEELDTAIAEARRQEIDVETVLMEQYKVPKAAIGASLSQFYNCQFVAFDEKVIPPPDVIKKFNRAYLKKNCWIPLRWEGNTLVALVDDLAKCKSIRELLRPVFGNREIRFVVGLRTDILLYISAAEREVFPIPLGPTEDAITTLIGSLQAEQALIKDLKDQEVETGELEANDSTIVRLINQIIIDSYKKRASDIHIELYGPSKDTVIRFRIDGSCMEYQRIPAAFRRAVVARLKIMAQLNIAESRKPQDGKIKFPLQDREIELRVATIPTAGGNEDVVMRVLAATEPIPIDQLGLTERNFRELKALAEKPDGLILVVGPTGSGKTTSLHSVLSYVNKPDTKIWTAEDPVEITQYGLRQVQVQPKIGFTFAEALRAFLRADPDVIMVGEMRDTETAAIGIEASLTGHLVFSTLHTSRAVETVIRLLDMGMDSFNFADALLGVLAQRLVKQICQDCKEAYHPSKDAYDELARFYGEEEFEKLGVKYDEAFVLYRGRGCGACNQTGYLGRAGIHELMVASNEIKRLISAKAKMTAVLDLAKAGGMTTLVQDGILKCILGVTDFKQVKTVAVK